MVLGRTTCEGFAVAWPSRSGERFADKFNAMPKYVASTRLQNLEWSAEGHDRRCHSLRRNAHSMEAFGREIPGEPLLSSAGRGPDRCSRFHL